MRSQEQLVSGQTLSVAASPLGYPTTTRSGPWVALYLPLLVHPVAHFFVGAGPSVFHEFGAAQGGPNVGGERTSLGASFIVGGYWGGSSSPVVDQGGADSPPPPPAAARRFGDAGDVVLTSAIVASLFSVSYAGTDSSQITARLEPSLDVFVADRVSLGVDVSLAYAGSTGIDPVTGRSVTFGNSAFGIEPRVGFDVRVAPRLSWYPRLGIGLGLAGTDEASGPNDASYGQVRVQFGADAPFLVHVADHFFVGFGPYLSIDLSDTLTFPSGASVQNDATSVGADLVVGGWL